MKAKLRNIGIIVLCGWVFAAMALVLLLVAIFLWILLYTVFLIPCLILYVIVAVRKQMYWKAENKGV